MRIEVQSHNRVNTLNCEAISRPSGFSMLKLTSGG